MQQQTSINARKIENLNIPKIKRNPIKKKKKRVKRKPRIWNFFATNEVYEVGEKDSKGDLLTYTKVPMENNWIDAQKFRPERFDLVALDYGEKVLNGWWDGNRWCGLRIDPKEEPLLWSRRDHD